MRMHDATEVAYKNGYEAGEGATAQKILSGIREKIQKVSFSNIKERFLVLDLIKSYEEEYRDREGGMNIRVPYAMEIGQIVYAVLDPTLCDGEIVDEEYVTDIGVRGFWISAKRPYDRDHGNFIAWNQINNDIFFTLEDAKAAATLKLKK